MENSITSRLSDDIREFLGERRFAVVATTNADGTPQPTPVWYELQGDEVLINTKRGRKKDGNVRRDPRVAVCVEDGYRWVTLSGTAQIIDDQRIAQPDIRRLAARYEGPDEADKQMREKFSREERVTWRIRIQHVVGEGFRSLER